MNVSRTLVAAIAPDTRDVAEPRSDLTIGTPGATAVDSRSTRAGRRPHHHRIAV